MSAAVETACWLRSRNWHLGGVSVQTGMTSLQPPVRLSGLEWPAAATAVNRLEKVDRPPQQPRTLRAGRDMTQSELKASAEWAAAALESTQYVGGPDATHAAGCAAIAQVLRELHGSSSGCAAAWQEYEAVVQAEQELKPQHTWAK
jgi:hypothetical protein